MPGLKNLNRGLLAAMASLSAYGAQALGAETASPGNQMNLELNKLEEYEKGCRAYLVVNNPTSANYQSFKLDLVLFQADGVIGRRVALELAPLRPQKKTVKIFELENTPCDKIGSFLVNEILECKSDAGTLADCLKQISTSALTAVKFSK